MSAQHIGSPNPLTALCRIRCGVDERPDMTLDFGLSRMINDLDRTIEELLIQELSTSNGPVEISFSSPNGDWVSKLGNTPTLNFFLYDVRENAPLRRHQWQQLTAMPATAGQTHNGRNGPSANESAPDLRRASAAHLKRTPLMLDCHYMVSAWSPADDRTRPIDEHRLLSLCMMALARYPILNPERVGAATMLIGHSPSQHSRPPAQNYLMGQLATQALEIRTRLAHHDVMTNSAEVWSALESQMKAAFSYVVTLPLDPWDKSVQLAERVGVVEITTKQMRHKEHPAPYEEADHPPIDDEPGGAGPHSQTLYRLGGRVWNVATRPAEPAPRSQVVIIEPDLLSGVQTLGLCRRTHTDSQGRFSFPRLLPGVYMILVGPDIDKPLGQKDVNIIASTAQLPDERTNILVDIEVELP